MSYPKTWTDLQAARQAWTPPAEIEEAFAPLAMSASAYAFCIGAFDLLKPHAETLDNEGLGVLLGAAHMINAAQFDGRHAEALAFLIDNAGAYVSPPPPALPEMPTA